MEEKFNKLEKKCIDYNCELLTLFSEFKTFDNNNPVIKFIASCNHEDSSRYKYFMHCKKTFYCKKCTYKNTGILLKNLKLDLSGQEDNSFDFFNKLLKNNFIVKKTSEGCKYDFAIKPINTKEDIWLAIQLKTTNKNDKYRFVMHNKTYEDCLVICHSILDNKIWIIDSNKLPKISAISIGKNKSIYDLYKTDIISICNKLEIYYQDLKKFNFCDIITNTGCYNLFEQEYRKFRESKINFLNFEYSDRNGLVHDFIINGYKVQEKTAIAVKNNNRSFNFRICRLLSGNKHSYELGDNDFYWLNSPNKDYFFVIPEKILIHQKIINTDKNKHVYVNVDKIENTVYKDYLFNYNDIDKEKLLSLFDVKSPN